MVRQGARGHGAGGRAPGTWPRASEPRALPQRWGRTRTGFASAPHVFSAPAISRRYPPGHGDLYKSLYTSGTLQKLLDAVCVCVCVCCLFLEPSPA